MFFYQNHLGSGVFSSSCELDWDELYCEECGDSDRFLGEADTAEELIQILLSEEYSIPDISSIVEENFGTAYEVCVILKNHSNDMVYLNFQPKRCKFGQKQEYIQYPCIGEEYLKDTALELLEKIDVPEIEENSLKEIQRQTKNGKIFVVFECYSNISEFPEGASYGLNNGWWGWLSPKDENFKLDIIS